MIVTNHKDRNFSPVQKLFLNFATSEATKMKRTPVCTEDGTYTFKIEELGECYHSSRGARREAQEVYLQAGLAYYLLHHPQAHSVRLFEMGFGAGLNAWLTYQYANEHQIVIEYITVEKYPIDIEELQTLPYHSDPDFTVLHQAPWELPQPCTPYFCLLKQQADMLLYTPPKSIDVVYFDAFAPNIQPDLWSPDLFAALYRSMRSGAVLVTYSAKGSVKQALRAAGFTLQRLKGSGGKRHMLRAIKE